MKILHVRAALCFRWRLNEKATVFSLEFEIAW
jgi:hypothetical protein